MISLDVINEKQISIEVDGDEITINVIKSAPTTFVALLDTPDAIQANQFLRGNTSGLELEFFKYARRDSITLVDGATINIDLDNYLLTHGLLNDTARIATILDFDKVFGLDLGKEEDMVIPGKVKKLVEEREKARKKKDWKKADEIRKKINKEGYVIDDTKGGNRIRKNA